MTHIQLTVDSAINLYNFYKERAKEAAMKVVRPGVISVQQMYTEQHSATADEITYNHYANEILARIPALLNAQLLASKMEGISLIQTIPTIAKAPEVKNEEKPLDIDTTKDEIKEIEQAYAFQPGFPHDFTGYHPSQNWLLQLVGHYEWVEPEKSINSS